MRKNELFCRFWNSQKEGRAALVVKNREKSPCEKGELREEFRFQRTKDIIHQRNWLLAKEKSPAVLKGKLSILQIALKHIVIDHHGTLRKVTRETRVPFTAFLCFHC